jgi:hypothetical protein
MVGRFVALSLLLLVPMVAVARADQDVAYGLAARYPNDVGIGQDPDVLIVEDYEIADLDELKAKGWSWSKGGEVYSLSTEPGLAFAGKRCLVKTMRTGAEGAIMPIDLKEAEDGPVYHRMYTKIPGNTPGVRVMGITGVRTGWPTWKAIGSAGLPADGTNYYCVTLTVMNHNGKLVPMWYPYHADQAGPWGSNWSVDAEFPADRWFCLEIMVKLTTPGRRPGSRDTYRDGELRMWVDGKEVYTRTDLRFRTVPEVKNTMIFDQCYSSQKFANDAVMYADNRVVARKYIGPLVSGRREPTPPAMAAAETGAPVAEEAKPEGLARKHPGDAGIGAAPDVLLFEDYEESGLADLEKRGWVPRLGPGLWVDGTGEKPGWGKFELAGGAFSGERCLKMTAVKEDWGAKATWNLPSGEEVLFLRTYLKLSKDLPAEETRILEMTGGAEGGPVYQVYGAETPRSDGSGPFWVVLLLHNWQQNGEIRGRNLRVELKKTDLHFVTSADESLLPVDKWFCLEMMVKLNTPGKKDGEARLWVDGEEVFRHTGLSLRKTESVKLRAVAEQLCADSRPFAGGGVVALDNLAVARKYIGLMSPPPK